VLTKFQASRLRGLITRATLKEKHLFAFRADKALGFDQGEAKRRALIESRDAANEKLFAFIREVTE